MFDKICMTEHLNIKNSAVNISKINLAFSSFSKYCILLGKRAFLLRYNAKDDYILLTNPSAVFCMPGKINKLRQCLFFKLFNNNNVCLG